MPHQSRGDEDRPDDIKDDDPGPAAHVMWLVVGAWASQLTCALVQLGVPAALAGGAMTVTGVARVVDADGPSLARALRAAESLGLVTSERLAGEERYQLTAVGELLCPDVTGSVAGLASLIGSDFHRAGWSSLAEGLRLGRPAFELAHGRPLFDYVAEHTDAAAVLHAASFNPAVFGPAQSLHESLADRLDLGWTRSVVDVGGGTGSLMIALLRRNPQMRGIVFDLPEVAAAAAAELAAAGMGERATAVGGSMFEEVPPGHDAYLLKSIVHDWDDDLVVGLLRSCRKAACPDSLVVLIENVVTTDSRAGALVALLDVEMLVASSGGRQRTLEEIDSLARRAGLTVVSTTVDSDGLPARIVCRPTSP